MNIRVNLLGAVAMIAVIGVARADESSATGQSAVVRHTPYTWADVATWPDLGTGLWAGGGGLGGPPGGAPPGGVPGGLPGGSQRGGGPASGIPVRPAVLAAANAVKKQSAKSYGNCEPMGVVADSGNKFYVGKDVIVIGGLFDWYNPWRRIYMNRTSHDDPEPSYFGDSIGHWEGKTLVVDTTGIRARDQIVQNVPLNSDDTHVVERIALTGPNTLVWDKTVYNPKVFTKPWHTVRTLTRDTDDGDFAESYCWEDRDQGNTIDLTPPPE